jgi:hypothetical protein
MSRIRLKENYWAMSLKDNIIHHLPKLFNKVHYDMILKFMEMKLPFNPLHVCDLMVDANMIHNPTPKFTIGKLIYFNDNGVEDMASNKDNWAFVKKIHLKPQ